MSHHKAGARFGVSATSVSRWHQREREEGKPLSKALGGNWRSQAIEAHGTVILAIIAETRDIKLAEIKARQQEIGVRVNIAGLWRFFDPTGSRSKESAHAGEQDRPDVLTRREEWFEEQLDLDPERLVFINETLASTNMARRRGRSLRGELLRVGVPRGHWKTTPFVGALTLRGFIAP